MPITAQEKLSSSSLTGLASGIQYRKAALITDFRHTFQKVAKESKYVLESRMCFGAILMNYRLLKANMLSLKKNKTALITIYMVPAYKSAIGEHGM